MTGRVVVVTGASSGLGYEVARYLAEGGNDVILACRSEERANRAIEKIKRLHPNALVTFMQVCIYLPVILPVYYVITGISRATSHTMPTILLIVVHQLFILWIALDGKVTPYKLGLNRIIKFGI